MELYDAVLYVYENGIMNGMYDTLFDPFRPFPRYGRDDPIPMEGSPEVLYTRVFTDIPDETWYTDGVE